MSQLAHIICANWHILICDLSLVLFLTIIYLFLCSYFSVFFFIYEDTLGQACSICSLDVPKHFLFKYKPFFGVDFI